MPWAGRTDQHRSSQVFQSLEVLPWGRLWIQASRFNPCSGGSIALGTQLDGDTAPRCHVYMFWWKYCRAIPGSGTGLHGTLSILVLVEVLPWAGTDEWFQSLFWWKYCPGKEVRIFHRCFNPCSGGSIALGNKLVASLDLIDVSIVLVEVLPWDTGMAHAR